MSTPSLTVALSDDLVNAVAERVLERLAEREGGGDDEWLHGAQRIAEHIGCSRSRVYQLVSARRIPVKKDGGGLVARRSEIDRWLSEGGAKCP